MRAITIIAAEQPSAAPRRFRPKLYLYVVLALFAILIGWLTIVAPPWRMRDLPAGGGVLVLAADDTTVALVGGRAGAGEAVDVTTLPPHVRNAFIAIEDRRFYRHLGIDPFGLARAFWHNLRAGRVVEGGSTITQQYAKMAYLNGDRSMGRKLREMMIALWLETWLSKDEILSNYVSTAYYGDGRYGLRAAARHYFDRDPTELSVDQAAMFAGMVKAPSRLAPTDAPEAAAERTRTVLGAMAKSGYLDATTGRHDPDLRLSPGREAVPSGTYFSDWVVGSMEDEVPGGTVRTTLDSDLQRRAVAAVARASLRPAQVALVAMRPDGKVVAMVGGRSYRASSFNRATRARRQPGSTFKLFTYLAALRDGADPDMLVDDEPIEIDGWKPTNADGVYRGPITLRDAFAVSSNVAAVRVSQIVGRDKVAAMVRDLGISEPLPAGPSYALGTGSMTLLELTSAYAAVAAGAYPVRPYAIVRAKGQAAPERRRFDVEREWQPMLDMLWQAANEGTGRLAALSQPTFGKTGTTQDNRDALFVGFAGDLVVGVWVGRDDNQPVPGLSGGKLPALIWRDFMGGARLNPLPQGTPSVATTGAPPFRATAGSARVEPRATRHASPRQWRGRGHDKARKHGNKHHRH